MPSGGHESCIASRGSVRGQGGSMAAGVGAAAAAAVRRLVRWMGAVPPWPGADSPNAGVRWPTWNLTMPHGARLAACPSCKCYREQPIAHRGLPRRRMRGMSQQSRPMPAHAEAREGAAAPSPAASASYRTGCDVGAQRAQRDAPRPMTPHWPPHPSGCGMNA